MRFAHNIATGEEAKDSTCSQAPSTLARTSLGETSQPWNWKNRFSMVQHLSWSISLGNENADFDENVSASNSKTFHSISLGNAEILFWGKSTPWKALWILTSKSTGWPLEIYPPISDFWGKNVYSNWWLPMWFPGDLPTISGDNPIHKLVVINVDFPFNLPRENLLQPGNIDINAPCRAPGDAEQ